MALTCPTATDEVIGIPEYLEYVRKNVDLMDLDSIADSAPLFRALLNNSRAITDILNRELKDLESFQGANTYTAQTFMLATAPGFFLRANVWAPPSSIPEVAAAEAQNFYYLIPHDHNFTFMTGGYLGSGYRTKIWEYDQSKLEGMRGERAGFRLLDTSLTPRQDHDLPEVGGRARSRAR